MFKVLGPNLKVAQISLYRRIASCRPIGIADQRRLVRKGLQVKNLRYSPADAGRYAFGLTSTINLTWRCQYQRAARPPMPRIL